MLDDILYFNPTLEGYNTFRVFHSECINGLIHTVGMPIATIGLFLFVFGLLNRNFSWTRVIQHTMLGLFTILWSQYDLVGSILTYLLYYLVFKLVLEKIMLYYQHRKSNFWFLTVGTLLLAGAVLFQEFIGHSLFEGHNSHLREVFNSIFHAPLYGVNCLRYIVFGICH